MCSHLITVSSGQISPRRTYVTTENCLTNHMAARGDSPANHNTAVITPMVYQKHARVCLLLCGALPSAAAATGYRSLCRSPRDHGLPRDREQHSRLDGSCNVLSFEFWNPIMR